MLPAIAALFILNLISITVFALSNHKKNQRIHNLEALVKRKTNELQALCRGAVGIGERMTAVEKFTQNLVSRAKESRPTVLDGNHYNQARKLFELGASLDDVMKSCHLSKEEAELIALLSHSAHVKQR